MNLKALLTILISGLLFFSSCKESDETDYAFNYITISYYESFRESGRDLLLYLQTTETFPCENFLLKAYQTQASGYIEIVANEIEVPEYCVTAIGPATQTMVLGNPEKLYSNYISLYVNDKKHDFYLRIRDQKIYHEVTGDFDKHLFFDLDTLNRIPDHTLWGYFLLDTLQRESVAENILDAFYRAGAHKLYLNDGNYHYFTVKDNQLVFDNIHEDALTFCLKYEHSMATLSEIIVEMTQTLEHTNIQVRMFNTRGERYIQ